jgi:hypothetical protein
MQGTTFWTVLYGHRSHSSSPVSMSNAYGVRNPYAMSAPRGTFSCPSLNAVLSVLKACPLLVRSTQWVTPSLPAPRCPTSSSTILPLLRRRTSPRLPQLCPVTRDSLRLSWPPLRWLRRTLQTAHRLLSQLGLELLPVHLLHTPTRLSLVRRRDRLRQLSTFLKRRCSARSA